jgi:hypothetical protein
VGPPFVLGWKNSLSMIVKFLKESGKKFINFEFLSGEPAENTDGGAGRNR